MQLFPGTAVNGYQTFFFSSGLSLKRRARSNGQTQAQAQNPQIILFRIECRVLDVLDGRGCRQLFCQLIAPEKLGGVLIVKIAERVDELRMVEDEGLFEELLASEKSPVPSFR